MAKSYEVVVRNKSGVQQTYALFGEKPHVEGIDKEKVWTNVIMSQEHVHSGATTKFTIWREYYAVCGSVSGGHAHGSQVSVGMTKPVTLGSRSADGIIHGTVLSMKADDETPPYFDDEPPSSSSTGFGSFGVVTGKDFTRQVATQKHYMLGVGTSQDGSDIATAATFVPEPAVSYQIRPTSTYYLTFGGDTPAPGELIETSKVSDPLALDFAASVTSRIEVVHEADGSLKIQKN